jgi:hypothetical protein
VKSSKHFLGYYTTKDVALTVNQKAIVPG